MSLRQAIWAGFLALFAVLLGAYAVWLAVSWTSADGGLLEEAATIFVIAALPALAAALNVVLVHTSRRGVVVAGSISLAAAIAAVVLPFADRDVSGFVAALAAVVLLAIAATAVAALRWDAGLAMMFAASIALLVATGVAMLTFGGALPISVALIVVAASTVNTARAQRLVPWWPIVAIVVVFVAATSGVALIVLAPIAVVLAAIVLVRRRGLKERVHVAEDRGD